jgi:hypothetical protein
VLPASLPLLSLVSILSFACPVYTELIQLMKTKLLSWVLSTPFLPQLLDVQMLITAVLAKVVNDTQADGIQIDSQKLC